MTDKSPTQLGLAGDPENFADPKTKLTEAIRFSNADKGPHLHVELSELYSTIGENINLSLLKNMNSYARFRNAMQEALVKIGFLLD